MKMYILVRNDVPVGHQVNCVGHATLGCYLQFRNDPDTQDWLEYSYRKVACSVSYSDFMKAKRLCDDWVVAREDALNYQEVALAFRPRLEYPEEFSAFRLFGQNRVLHWWKRLKKMLDFSRKVKYSKENGNGERHKDIALDQCVIRDTIKRE